LLDFYSPKITSEQVEDNHGTFVVEPLDRGFGYTFGNSLRRVLLSSLEGAAISAVKIDGVAHEFSSVRGVKEDVTDIILNLKRVVFVMHGEDNEMQVDLSREGPGAITAGDIDTPSNLEVVNPDAHIATLEEGARLELVLTVRRGRGYASANENKSDESVLGVIPIDSIFSPVSRVSYQVEPARVGQRTDFDKLTLEIETNGALDPWEALRGAATILQEHLRLFGDVDEPERESFPDNLMVSETVKSALRESGVDSEDELLRLWEHGRLASIALLGQAQVGELEDYLKAKYTGDSGRSEQDDMLIEELELGVRSYNCLKREGVETVGDLMSKSEAELLNIPNFGKKSIEEVRERLIERGLHLRGEDLSAGNESGLSWADTDESEDGEAS